MPWKFVFFLSGLLIAAFFLGYNLENRCDISFVFYTFREVPIFVSLLFAYVAGAVSILPFLLFRKKKTGKKSPSNKPVKEAGITSRDYDIN